MLSSKQRQSCDYFCFIFFSLEASVGGQLRTDIIGRYTVLNIFFIPVCFVIFWIGLVRPLRGGFATRPAVCTIDN